MAFAENLRGQGSGLSTRQAEAGPRAPENPTPPPTVGFLVNIIGLIQRPEVQLSLVVGKDGGEESATRILGVFFR